eukprot:SAG31_NODE_31562_length_366_cov_1.745318_1_plen_43_part_01
MAIQMARVTPRRLMVGKKAGRRSARAILGTSSNLRVKLAAVCF